MSDVDISAVLAQMRSMAARVEAGTGVAGNGPGAVQDADKPDFAQFLKQSIDAVNSTQKEAAALTEAFQAGAPGVELGEVMVALQKASVSFQAMTQVRNKLVDAYQEIMRMQG